jgi:hypothetical protein
MKYTITVTDKNEGEQIRAGLEDPAVRAFVKVYGVMKALPTDRARTRVLAYFADHVAEKKEQETILPAEVN